MRIATLPLSYTQCTEWPRIGPMPLNLLSDRWTANSDQSRFAALIRTPKSAMPNTDRSICR